MKIREPAITIKEAPYLVENSMQRFHIFLLGRFFSGVTFNHAGYLSDIPTSRFESVKLGEVPMAEIKREIELQNQRWADLSGRLLEIATASPKDQVAITLRSPFDHPEFDIRPGQVNQTVMLYGMVFGDAWAVRNRGILLPLPKPNGDIEFLSEKVTPAQKETTISQINALWETA